MSFSKPSKSNLSFKSLLAISCTGAALLMSMNANADENMRGNSALTAKIDLLEAQLNALRQEIQTGEGVVLDLEAPAQAKLSPGWSVLAAKPTVAEPSNTITDKPLYAGTAGVACTTGGGSLDRTQCGSGAVASATNATAVGGVLGQLVLAQVLSGIIPMQRVWIPHLWVLGLMPP